MASWILRRVKPNPLWGRYHRRDQTVGPRCVRPTPVVLACQRRTVFTCLRKKVLTLLCGNLLTLLRK